MVRTRLISLTIAASMVAGSALAEVKLVIRPDGTKMIYNTQQKRSSTRGSDLVWLAKQHNRASEYDEIISRHCARYGVDPVLAKAVIQVESNFNPDVVSHKGARGLMQLMPGTARRFGVEKVHDPEENIRGGVEYLSILQKMFKGNLQLVLAAYNAGEGAVSRYRGIPPYQETQTYVVRALSVYYGRPHGGGTVMFGGGRDKKLAGGFKAERGSGSLEPITLASKRRPASRQPAAR